MSEDQVSGEDAGHETFKKLLRKILGRLLLGGPAAPQSARAPGFLDARKAPPRPRSRKARRRLAANARVSKPFPDF